MYSGIWSVLNMQILHSYKQSPIQSIAVNVEITMIPVWSLGWVLY